MKRAMTDSAKAEKAQMILHVARELYLNNKYEEIKMSDIAKMAKISHGTLFYYYKTKEILFMEMLFLEYESRFRNFMHRLEPIGKMTYEEFKVFFLNEMAGILQLDSVFIRLSAIKNTILEKNIDEETALKVTRTMSVSLVPVLQGLMDRVGFLTAASFFQLLGAQNAIIVGYVNIASVPDVMFKAIIAEKLQGFELDFKKNALTAMDYYLDGWYRALTS